MPIRDCTSTSQFSDTSDSPDEAKLLESAYALAEKIDRMPALLIPLMRLPARRLLFLRPPAPPTTPAQAPKPKQESKETQPPSEEDKVTPLRGLPKTLAANMDESLTVPTATSGGRCAD